MEARVNNCFDRPTILCSLHELQEKKIQQNILLKRHKKSDIFLRNLESDIQYFQPKKITHKKIFYNIRIICVTKVMLAMFRSHVIM